MASTSEDTVMGVLGWVLATILVAFLLPMLSFLYLDILEAKHETKAQLEQVQKLRREIEKQKRDDKKPESFSENPVFDRRSKREHF
jgi:hypothetical protein